MSFANFVIKLFKGYTQDEYDNKVKELNNLVDAEKKKVENCNATIATLTVQNKQLSETINMLQSQLEKQEQEKPVVETFDGLYMMRSFEDMFLTIVEGEKKYTYLDAEKVAGFGNNSLNYVFTKIKGKLNGKTVTFEDFNKEFTNLYKDRFNVDLIDEYFKNQLIQVKLLTVEVPADLIEYRVYDSAGKLCRKSDMRPVTEI